MNESNEPEGEEQAEFRYDDLTSAREAAKLLRVSESTVWRWINQDIVPAYRVGRKRVWLRRSELESLIAPARGALRGGRRKEKRVSNERGLNLTAMAEVRRPGGGEVARARALTAAVLARRGGELLPEAWEDIDAAREERLAAL